MQSSVSLSISQSSKSSRRSGTSPTPVNDDTDNSTAISIQKNNVVDWTKSHQTCLRLRSYHEVELLRALPSASSSPSSPHVAASLLPESTSYRFHAVEVGADTLLAAQVAPLIADVEKGESALCVLFGSSSEWHIVSSAFETVLRRAMHSLGDAHATLSATGHRCRDGAVVNLSLGGDGRLNSVLQSMHKTGSGQDMHTLATVRTAHAKLFVVRFAATDYTGPAPNRMARDMHSLISVAAQLRRAPSDVAVSLRQSKLWHSLRDVLTSPRCRAAFIFFVDDGPSAFLRTQSLLKHAGALMEAVQGRQSALSVSPPAHSHHHTTTASATQSSPEFTNCAAATSSWTNTRNATYSPSDDSDDNQNHATAVDDPNEDGEEYVHNNAPIDIDALRAQLEDQADEILQLRDVLTRERQCSTAVKSQMLSECLDMGSSHTRELDELRAAVRAHALQVATLQRERDDLRSELQRRNEAFDLRENDLKAAREVGDQLLRADHAMLKEQVAQEKRRRVEAEREVSELKCKIEQMDREMKAKRPPPVVLRSASDVMVSQLMREVNEAIATIERA
eukprot:PhM_4_TR15850/c0_g1_i1/m.74895